MSLLQDPWGLVGWRRLSRCCSSDSRRRNMYQTALSVDPSGMIAWRCDCGKITYEKP